MPGSQADSESVQYDTKSIASFDQSETKLENELRTFKEQLQLSEDTRLARKEILLKNLVC